MLVFLSSISILVTVLLIVAYYVYFERKILGYMQNRIGPNRVGYFGLLQPIADAIKIFFKEVIVPNKSNKNLFFIAPILSFFSSYSAWAVIPIGYGMSLSRINIGLLYIMSISSIGVYGIIIAGWSCNSKFGVFSAIRASAQFISYEIPMSLCILGVVIASGSLNLEDIVKSQSGGILHWYFLPLFPLFVIYFISGLAETNRSPFNAVEGESEIIAGHHIEYSGSKFALFFLSEYSSMMLISFLTPILFLGGLNSPLEGIPYLCQLDNILPQPFWLFLKSFFFMFFFIWIRATVPSYRYDQVMRLGWKIFIPLTLIWIVMVSLMVKVELPPWWGIKL